jgi:hypothetical protein
MFSSETSMKFYPTSRRSSQNGNFHSRHNQENVNEVSDIIKNTFCFPCRLQRLFRIVSEGTIRDTETQLNRWIGGYFCRDSHREPVLCKCLMWVARHPVLSSEKAPHSTNIATVVWSCGPESDTDWMTVSRNVAFSLCCSGESFTWPTICLTTFNQPHNLYSCQWWDECGYR